MCQYLKPCMVGSGILSPSPAQLPSSWSYHLLTVPEQTRGLVDSMVSGAIAWLRFWFYHLLKGGLGQNHSTSLTVSNNTVTLLIISEFFPTRIFKFGVPP